MKLQALAARAGMQAGRCVQSAVRVWVVGSRLRAAGRRPHAQPHVGRAAGGGGCCCGGGRGGCPHRWNSIAGNPTGIRNTIQYMRGRLAVAGQLAPPSCCTTRLVWVPLAEQGSLRRPHERVVPSQATQHLCVVPSWLWNWRPKRGRKPAPGRAAGAPASMAAPPPPRRIPAAAAAAGAGRGSARHTAAAVRSPP